MEMTTLTARLKLIRKQQKLNQTDFGKLVGVSQTALANYETGRVVPTDTFLKLLCSKFNVSEKWLMEGIGEMLGAESSALEQLKTQYNLTDEYVKFVEAFLSLDDGQKKAVLEFARRAAAQSVPQSDNSAEIAELKERMDALEQEEWDGEDGKPNVG